MSIETNKCCDHKFVDSNHCLKCGWQPFCGQKKFSHPGCCPPDPNRVEPAPRKKKVRKTRD